MKATCRGCESIWDGNNTCHCSVCHETFITVSNFDRHRSPRGEYGSCLDPAKAGLVLSDRAYRAWMSLRDADSEATLRNLRASRSERG